MPEKRLTSEGIVMKLRQGDWHVSQGNSVPAELFEPAIAEIRREVQKTLDRLVSPAKRLRRFQITIFRGPVGSSANLAQTNIEPAQYGQVLRFASYVGHPPGRGARPCGLRSHDNETHFHSYMYSRGRYCHRRDKITRRSHDGRPC